MVALVMMTVAVILRTAPRIEGEGVDQRSLLPVFRRLMDATLREKTRVLTIHIFER